VCKNTAVRHRTIILREDLECGLRGGGGYGGGYKVGVCVAVMQEETDFRVRVIFKDGEALMTHVHGVALRQRKALHAPPMHLIT